MDLVSYEREFVNRAESRAAAGSERLVKRVSVRVSFIDITPTSNGIINVRFVLDSHLGRRFQSDLNDRECSGKPLTARIV